MIERVFVFWPPPHVAEHSPKSPYSETWQAAGQSSVLHNTVSSRAGQYGPFDGYTLTVRWRVLCPPPHVLLQAPHVPQSFTSHGVGMPLHDVWPAWPAVYWPAGQSRHCGLPAALMYLPDSHLTHFDWPSATWNLPSGHCTQ